MSMNVHLTFIIVTSKLRAPTRWAHIHVLVIQVGLVMDIFVKVLLSNNLSLFPFLCSFLLITRTKTSTYASDVNECTLNLHNCHEQATCANTLGSYSCACNSGWTGNGLTCEGN